MRSVVLRPWWSNPLDRRVVAALAVECPLCHVRAGVVCAWPIGSRLIHEIRVPSEVLGVAK